MNVPTQFFEKENRAIAYAEYGREDGVPVFFAHGSPGSRLTGTLFHEGALRHGFRLICIDRPGMGYSTYDPNRTFLDYPRDIADLADHLGIEQFGVMGWSGGGAHALACAFVVPDRLLFCFSFAGYTNFAELPGAVDLFPLKVDQESIRLGQKKSWLFPMMYDLLSLTTRYLPKYFLRTLIKAIPEADREVLNSGNTAELFMTDQKEAFRQGGKGIAHDARIHYEDWGYRSHEITGKVDLFYGPEDSNAPFEFGEHLNQTIPNVELHVMEGCGHFFPISHQDMIFEMARKLVFKNLVES